MPGMSTPKPEHSGHGHGLDPVSGPASGTVLGILGGTFDPVHLGHRGLADAALTSGAVSRIRWIPAGHPPHRGGPSASADHRLAMVQLMIADQPAYELDASEVESGKRGEPSYTVTTLERLRRELGAEQPLALILGADAFLGLPSWHRWTEIPALTHLMVTTRPGSPLDDSTLPDALRQFWENARTDDPATLAELPAGRIYNFPMPALEVSATGLRQRLASHDANPDINPVSRFEGLLPPALVRYIRHHHLYT